MAVLGSQLISWHAYMAFFIGISRSVYPLAEKTIDPFGIIAAAFLLAKAEISQEKPVHSISKKERQNLCQQIKSLELTVTGLKTKEAMITQRGN